MSRNQVQWACRRGMLELDLILNDFVEQAYETLSPLDHQRFEALLSCTDAELADWLLSAQQPPEELQEIVGLIHRYAHRLV